MDTEAYDDIRLFWTDLNGVARGVLLPAEELEGASEEGVGFANGVAELTLEPGLLDDPKYGPQGGDMMAIADTDSLMTIEWREGSAAFFGSGNRRWTAVRPLPAEYSPVSS